MMKPKKHKLKRKKYNAKYFGIFFVAIFLAGIFLFGGKIQSYAESKLVAKGNFYLNGGAYDLEKAVKYYKVAAFVEAKASFPHYQLARVYFMKADYKNGLAEIDRALALNPENKRAFYIRGLIDGYAGNLDAAADDFQKFIAWAPKEWAGYNDLAWVYYQNKDYQKAADAAHKGLDAVPNNAWLLNGLGVSLEALGENDQAKVALDQAQALSSKLTPADWKRAYPGNNAESAPWDLAQFKTDVKFNLGLASGQNIFSAGKGKFQAACGSTQQSHCSGTSCTSVTCDPDHSGSMGLGDVNEVGIPYCTWETPCSTDCDCGGGPWKPVACVPAGTLPAGCIDDNVHHPHSETVASCEASGRANMSEGYCFPISDRPGSWCVDQTHDCPNRWQIIGGLDLPMDQYGRWVVVDACPGSCTLAFDPTSMTIGKNSPGTVQLKATGDCKTVTLSSDDTGKATVSPPTTLSNFKDTTATVAFNTLSVAATTSTNIAAASTALTNSRDAVLPLTITYTPPSPFCGDLTCNNGETCSTCPTDCGACPPQCGNGICGSGENCNNCPADCGACPPSSSCDCGSISGICNNTWPAGSVLCSTGSAGNQVPGGLYGTWNWTCGGSCGSPASCSASGKGHCGWVETNP